MVSLKWFAPSLLQPRIVMVGAGKAVDVSEKAANKEQDHL